MSIVRIEKVSNKKEEDKNEKENVFISTLMLLIVSLVFNSVAFACGEEWVKVVQLFQLNG